MLEHSELTVVGLGQVFVVVAKVRAFMEVFMNIGKY